MNKETAWWAEDCGGIECGYPRVPGVKHGRNSWGNHNERDVELSDPDDEQCADDF